MAMLAAWLGLQGALLSFAIGVTLGAVAALVVLLLPSTRKNHDGWAVTKLPLGTFLCVGGIVSSLWGEQMIDAYRALGGVLVILGFNRLWLSGHYGCGCGAGDADASGFAFAISGSSSALPASLA